mgnify:CR=1 FL=1
MPKRRPEPEAALPWERKRERPRSVRGVFHLPRYGLKPQYGQGGAEVRQEQEPHGQVEQPMGMVERARAYDNDLERQERAEAAKDLKEARKRQRKTGYFMQKKATEALDRLNVEDLDANAIIRLIVEGAKLERGNLLEEAGFLHLPAPRPAAGSRARRTAA